MSADVEEFKKLLMQLLTYRATGKGHIDPIVQEAENKFQCGRVFSCLLKYMVPSFNFDGNGKVYLIDAANRIAGHMEVPIDALNNFINLLKLIKPVAEDAQSVTIEASGALLRLTYAHAQELCRPGKLPYLLFVRFVLIHTFSLRKLIENGTIPNEELAVFLVQIVLAGCRGLIIGPAASGKSTIMNAILAEAHKYLQKLSRTPSIIAHAGDATDFVSPPFTIHLPNLEPEAMRRLSRRSNSNFMVVGEVASREIMQWVNEVLPFCRTFLATMHANSPDEVFSQFALATGLSPDYFRQTISLLIHMEPYRGGYPIIGDIYVNPAYYRLTDGEVLEKVVTCIIHDDPPGYEYVYSTKFNELKRRVEALARLLYQ